MELEYVTSIRQHLCQTRQSAQTQRYPHEVVLTYVLGSEEGATQARKQAHDMADHGRPWSTKVDLGKTNIFYSGNITHTIAPHVEKFERISLVVGPRK